MRAIKSLILSLSLFGCVYAGIAGSCDPTTMRMGDGSVVTGSIIPSGPVVRAERK